MSSHREAPAISKDPVADNTDTYAFVSPDDPGSVKPGKLDTAVVCSRCHEANAAKPKNFPQVATADHSGGLACDTCHQPHHPKIETGKTTTAKTPTEGKK